MIAVINITGNNLTSIGNALTGLKQDFEFTHCIETIKKATHVILPGVGAADVAMKALNDYQLIDVIRELQQPLLGICLGMQLLCEYSEEGQVDCLGLIPGRIEKLQASWEFPAPHMGWNRMNWLDEPAIMQNLNPEDYVYFVHGYALHDSEFAVATCNDSREFAAVIQKGNKYGMQFHPEKSGSVGLTLLKNFCLYSSLVGTLSLCPPYTTREYL